MDLISLLFRFDGRINRGKYWLAMLIYFIVWTAFMAMVFSWAGNIFAHDVFGLLGAGVAIWAAVVLLTVAAIWSGLATGIKRLHDRDKSGWWIVLFWLGPSFLSGAGTASNYGGGTMILSLASAALGIWAFVELACLKGTAGPNRFGDDPLGVAVTL
jgi:uncharacterized membrane protein YhaH (DUF805 family)